MTGFPWRTAAIAFVFLAAAIPARGAGLPIVYTTGGTAVFRVEAPDNWTVRVGEEVDPARLAPGVKPMPRIVSLMPEGGAQRVWTGMWSPPGVTGLDGGVAYVKSLDQKLLSDTLITDTKDGGLPAGPFRHISGTGKRLGAPVAWDIAIVALPTGRVVVAAFVGEAEARAELLEDFTRTMNSIRVEGGK